MDADGCDIGIDGIDGNHGGFDCFGGIDGFGFGRTGFAPSSGACGHSCDAADTPGRGVLHVDDAIAVAMGPHGALDVKALFSRLASQSGMVAIGARRLQLDPVDETHYEILNRYGAKPKGDASDMPAGWYPGATGWTRTWREFWQIGTDPLGWRSGQPLRRYLETRTYLSVATITWAYAEALDQQTMVVVRLISLPVHDPVQKWLIDSDSRKQHHKAAHAVGEKLFEILKQTSPGELSVFKRRQIAEARPTGDDQKPADEPGCDEPGAVCCSGADLANLIPGFGMPAKSGGRCPDFVLVVDPDAFPNPSCQPGCGSTGTTSGAHQHGPGYGKPAPSDPRLEPDHDPYFDGRPRDDADGLSGPDGSNPGYADADYED